MNNFENKYEEISEEADELLELDKLSEEDNAPEDLEALDGENAEENTNAEKSEELITVIGVRFKETGKIYYFSPKNTVFAIGDHVIVDTSRGMEYGTVCMANREMRTSEVVLPIREVIRKATAEDTARRRKNEDLEITAFNTFIERMTAHQLEMKLIDVECAFDNSKLLFYFSAETRIDFRELVRDLATAFHTRIELRQIGIRDEAKMLGGLGICGRPFCCSSFLSDFVQVSIKMAKEQNLSLNAAKISGACGKLMCCLRYEYDSYQAEKALTPKVGAEVMTPDGEGVVSEANPMTGIVKVKLAGTAEDDAPAVFIREDLVLKANYNGEKLTKTPLPVKRSPAAVLNNSFEVRSPFAEQAESDTETASAGRNDGKGKDRKKKDKRGENAQAGQKPDRQERAADQPDSGKNGGKDKGKNSPQKPDRNDKNGKPFKPNGGHGKSGKPEATAPHNGEQGKNRPQQKSFPPKNQNGEKPEGGKKPFKPFHRKGNKNGGNGNA